MELSMNSMFQNKPCTMAAHREMSVCKRLFFSLPSLLPMALSSRGLCPLWNHKIKRLFPLALPSLSSFLAFPSLLNPATGALNFHPAAAVERQRKNSHPKPGYKSTVGYPAVYVTNKLESERLVCYAAVLQSFSEWKLIQTACAMFPQANFSP